MISIGVCEFCQKESKVYKVRDLDMHLCKRHASQYYEMGKLYERTVHDPNEIVIGESYAEVLLYDKNHDVIEKSKIDLEDVEKACRYKWYLSQGYCYSGTESIFLHGLVLNHTSNKNTVVDHINRDRLDNRKSNLRVIDFSMNGFNKGKQSNNTSGYVGVSWDKSRNKWEAHIKKDRRKRFLGYFDNLEDAADARKSAELELFGEIRNSKYDKNTVFKKVAK